MAILPNVKLETKAMTRVFPKTEQLSPKARKANVLEDLPDLLGILADIKKILGEEELQPKYKH